MVYLYIFMFSLTGYFGLNVVLNLVKIYGALIAVTGMSQYISGLLVTSFLKSAFCQCCINVNPVSTCEMGE